MPTNSVVCPEGDDKVAVQAVDSAEPESTELIPLYNTDDELLRELDEDQVRELLRRGCATVFRSRSGKVRRVYLTLTKRAVEKLDQRSSILSDASRTIRKERLTAPLWCYSHINQDLQEKLAVEQEELGADVVPGAKLPKEPS